MSYLLNQLAEMGHDVHIGYFDEGMEGGMHDLPNVHLHKIKSNGHYDPIIVWRLARLMREIKPDVVHSWHYLMDMLGELIILNSQLEQQIEASEHVDNGVLNSISRAAK